MTAQDPQPTFNLLRPLTLAVAALAVFLAISGIVASLTLLAWVVAVIAVVVFAASFYLKARL